jgi:hypothetical protein
VYISDLLRYIGVFTKKMPKIAKILLQRAEEIFPALKESTVSVVCME